MKEFYFVRGGGEYKELTFVVFKYENNEWRESVVSPRVGQPVISPDGNTMHLGWQYMERTETGWSELKEHEGPFKELLIMRDLISQFATHD